MTDVRTPAPSAPPERTAKSSSGLFRASWRWHFYASFLVLPILLLLATTGLIYLLAFQLEPLMHGDERLVEPSSGQFRSFDVQQSAAEEAYPDASDQDGGQVASAYGFDDYPTLAEVVSQSIGLHEGRSLGLVAFCAGILMCSAVIFSCISGPLMLRRRRPKNASSMGAPRGRMPIKSSPLLVVGLADWFDAV